MASNTVEAKAPDTAERGFRREAEGIVSSDVRRKTITVEIERLFKHARYGKYIVRTTKVHAHDEKNEAKKGDRVLVVETRPISKQKRWRLVKVVERAAVLGSLDIKDVEIAPKKEARPAAPKAEEAAAKPAE
jgi:small subunit ribosomal protein S17